MVGILPQSLLYAQDPFGYIKEVGKDQAKNAKNALMHPLDTASLIGKKIAKTTSSIAKKSNSWFDKKVVRPLDKVYQYVMDKEWDQDSLALLNFVNTCQKTVVAVSKFFPQDSSPSSNPWIAAFSNWMDKANKEADRVYDKIAELLGDRELIMTCASIQAVVSSIFLSLAVKNIYQEIKATLEAYRIRDFESCIERCVNALCEFGVILDSSISLTVALNVLTSVGKQILDYLPIIGLIAVAIKTINLSRTLLNVGQSYHQSKKFHEIIDSKEKDIHVKFEEVKEFLSDEPYIKNSFKYFGRSQSWILDIINKVNEPTDKERVIKILAKRLDSAKWSYGMNAASTVLTITTGACAVVPAATPAAPFFGVAALVVSVSNCVFTTYHRHAFRSGMEALAA